MNVTIAGPQVRPFGKVIHCLSKFGNDLCIEDSENGLVLKSASPTKSAFATFTFAKEFFYKYKVTTFDNDESENSRFYCKVTMKSILGVFKSLPNLDKVVDNCEIQSDEQGNKFTLKFYCKSDIVKIYELYGCETESLKTVYSKESCSNRIKMTLRVLGDILQTFSTKQVEVNLNASQDCLIVENNVEVKEPTSANQSVLTRFKLSSDEFYSYKIADDETQITFCLKELRGISLFSEFSDLPVEMFFHTPGKPIVFSFNIKEQIEADFVLATLLPRALSPEEFSDEDSSITREKVTKKNADFYISSTSGTSTSAAAKKSTMRDNKINNQLQTVVAQDATPNVKKFTSIFDTPTFFPHKTYEVLASDTDEEN